MNKSRALPMFGIVNALFLMFSSAHAEDYYKATCKYYNTDNLSGWSYELSHTYGEDIPTVTFTGILRNNVHSLSIDYEESGDGASQGAAYLKESSGGIIESYFTPEGEVGLTEFSDIEDQIADATIAGSCYAQQPH